MVVMIITGGPLVDRFVSHCDLMVAVCLTGGGIATIFVPWAPVVGLLWFIIVAQGTFEGVINIGNTTDVIIIKLCVVNPVFAAASE